MKQSIKYVSPAGPLARLKQWSAWRKVATIHVLPITCSIVIRRKTHMKNLNWATLEYRVKFTTRQ